MLRYVTACVNEYFHGEIEASGEDKSSEDPIYKGYKSFLVGSQGIHVTDFHGSSMLKLELFFANSDTLRQKLGMKISTLEANNQDKRRIGVRTEIIMTKYTKNYD
ncbi:hypothetical protein AHAS_Ahas17G0061800 [Arachis hypogaea]